MTNLKRPKVSVLSLLEKKRAGQRIAVVTAYDATMATLFDEAEVDVLMVGDSLGMVVQGWDSTLPVTLEQMIYHSACVARAKPSAHIVADLPFLSYQASTEQAVISAGRLLKEGHAEGVKLEGGLNVLAQVKAILAAGIPVMGHLGLTPQSVHQLGGFKAQARTQESIRRLFEDARALAQAGVYALVLEGVPALVARRVTENLGVPTIGIGAGGGVDGQVLVGHDMLGLYRGHRPKFVRRFGELGDDIVARTRDYAAAVHDGTFPSEEHEFHLLSGQALPNWEESP